MEYIVDYQNGMKENFKIFVTTLRKCVARNLYFVCVPC